MSSHQVLLVEDNSRQRSVIKEALDQGGFDVTACDGFESAMAALHDAPIPFSVAVLDLLLDYELDSSWRVLEQIKGRHVHTAVVILTGHGTSSMAVRAMKSGARDFLEKPRDSLFSVENLAALLLPPIRSLLNECEQSNRSEMKRLLKELSEDQLIDHVILPLLRTMGFLGVQRVSSHGPCEMGRDVLPFYKVGDFRERIYYAAQVKAGDVSGRAGHGSSVNALLHECSTALSFPFVDPHDRTEKRIDRCLAIVSGVLKNQARLVFDSFVTGRRDILLLESDDLIDLLQQHQLSDAYRRRIACVLRRAAG